MYIDKEEERVLTSLNIYQLPNKEGLIVTFILSLNSVGNYELYIMILLPIKVMCTK